jgi:hypothetical protein
MLLHRLQVVVTVPALSEDDVPFAETAGAHWRHLRCKKILFL